MSPEEAERRAELAARLERDEAFNLVMDEVKARHVATFLRSGASDEEVLEAHRAIGVLESIKGQVRRMKSDKALLDKKEHPAP